MKNELQDERLNQKKKPLSACMKLVVCDKESL